jgi:hypothetical protein
VHRRWCWHWLASHWRPLVQCLRHRRRARSSSDSSAQIVHTAQSLTMALHNVHNCFHTTAVAALAAARQQTRCNRVLNCINDNSSVAGTCCASTVARHVDDLADEQLFGLDPRVKALDHNVIEAARCAQNIKGVSGLDNIIACSQWRRRRGTWSLL